MDRFLGEPPPPDDNQQRVDNEHDVIEEFNNGGVDLIDDSIPNQLYTSLVKDPANPLSTPFAACPYPMYNSTNGPAGCGGGTTSSSSAATSSSPLNEIHKDQSMSNTLINQGEDDEMTIEGFKRSRWFTAFSWFGIVLSAGLVRLLFHWKPRWMLLATHNRCPLDQATKVLLKDQYGQDFVENVQQVTSTKCLNSDLEYSYQALDRRESQQNNRTKVATGSKSPIISHEHLDSASPPPEELADDMLIVPLGDGRFRNASSFSYFDNKRVRYLWDEDRKQFIRLMGLDDNVPSPFYYQQTGLSEEEQHKRRIVYGENKIEVEVQSILHILFYEVLGPFYVFQVFSIILWSFENYFYYAACIVIMSSLSLISSVIQIRKNQQQLHDTVEAHDTVLVVRSSVPSHLAAAGIMPSDKEVSETIESSALVPGDVILIPQFGGVMQCDAVLISGNVIVNESMLTGESVPVTKTPLPNIPNLRYNAKEHGKHTLFCGTKVIQTRNYTGASVRAVVIRCGFQTTKGELVRSIMFPKPVDWKLNRHIHKFIGFLALLALGGFIYTVILKARRGVHYTEILLRALDLVTIIIPPALPAAMTIGIIIAQSRLKKSNIFCISPRSINLSGCINCVCFDKTGTLTEDDLSFSHVVPIDMSTLSFQDNVENLSDHPADDLLICLATCHSLTRVGGNLIGDPLDYKMFETTGWVLEEPEVDDTSKFDLLAPTIVKESRPGGLEVGILRQFTFSSSLQRMSVVTRRLGGTSFEIYMKGAPEMIESLCVAASIPDNYHTVLGSLTQKGYRVLGLATRKIEMNYKNMQKARREELEQDLVFVGFLVMANMLKPQTVPIMRILMDANIRPIMVTGDNMLTALSVARECRMIAPNDKVVMLSLANDNSSPSQQHSTNPNEPPPLTWKWADQLDEDDEGNIVSDGEYRDSNGPSDLSSPSPKGVRIPMDPNIHVAVTGRTFRVLRDDYPQLFQKVCVRGTIFSRMAPEQKQQLIEELQVIGYFVGMCGDGANDCGALKAAHAGISLSEAEASVASPFTSKKPDISCVPILIKEGRASLVTSFGILKYMAGYSLTQFASVIILYTLFTNLTDWQFLYQDLFLITVFAALFGRTEPYPNLAKKPPPSSLIGITPLSSICIQALLVVIFQMSAVIALRFQPWYVPHSPAKELEENLASHDNYAVFAVSVFQYITIAVIFSKGAPYRKPIYTNHWLVVTLIAMTLVTIYLVTYPFRWLSHAFELDILEVSYEFRFAMVLLAFIHFLLAFLAESWLVDHIIFNKSGEIMKWFGLKRNVHTYESLDLETRDSTDWLPSAGSMAGGVSACSTQLVQRGSAVHGTSNGSANHTSPSAESIPSFGKSVSTRRDETVFKI